MRRSIWTLVVISIVLVLVVSNIGHVYTLFGWRSFSATYARRLAQNDPDLHRLQTQVAATMQPQIQAEQAELELRQELLNELQITDIDAAQANVVRLLADQPPAFVRAASKQAVFFRDDFALGLHPAWNPTPANLEMGTDIIATQSEAVHMILTDPLLPKHYQAHIQLQADALTCDGTLKVFETNQHALSISFTKTSVYIDWKERYGDSRSPRFSIAGQRDKCPLLVLTVTPFTLDIQIEGLAEHLQVDTVGLPNDPLTLTLGADTQLEYVAVFEFES